MAYQKQNLKQDIRTIKNLSTTKSTKMTHNYLRTLENQNFKRRASLNVKILKQYQPYSVAQNGTYSA